MVNSEPVETSAADALSSALDCAADAEDDSAHVHHASSKATRARPAAAVTPTNQKRDGLFTSPDSLSPWGLLLSPPDIRSTTGAPSSSGRGTFACLPALAPLPCTPPPPARGGWEGRGYPAHLGAFALVQMSRALVQSTAAWRVLWQPPLQATRKSPRNSGSRYEPWGTSLPPDRPPWHHQHDLALQVLAP